MMLFLPREKLADTEQFVEYATSEFRMKESENREYDVIILEEKS